MSKIKVAIIYQMDPLGQKVGGIETFTKSLIKYAPEDFDMTLVGVTSDPKNRPLCKLTRLKFANTEFDFFPLLFERKENKKRLVPLTVRFMLRLRSLSMDLSDSVLVFNRIEPLLFFKRTGAAKIAIIHSNINALKGTESLWAKCPRLYFIYTHLVFPCLNHLFAISSKTLEFYQSKYPQQQEKLSHLQSWADPSAFFTTDESKASIRKRLSKVYPELPAETKWILFAGRLQKVKSPFKAIEAVREYRKNDKTASLIIIGEGNLKAEMEKYIKKMDLQKNIFLLGGMDQKSLAQFYRASDLLLITSLSEAMPFCALEALACGLPVVSTDVGEIKRVVKNGTSGEIADGTTPEEISGAVQKVFMNTEIYSSDNCIKSVSEYSPSNVLRPLYEKIREQYREKCANGRIRSLQ